MYSCYWKSCRTWWRRDSLEKWSRRLASSWRTSSVDISLRSLTLTMGTVCLRGAVEAAVTWFWFAAQLQGGVLRRVHTWGGRERTDSAPDGDLRGTKARSPSDGMFALFSGCASWSRSWLTARAVKSTQIITHGMCSRPTMPRLDWELGAGQIMWGFGGHGEELGFWFEYNEKPL